jgi:hypothetical protein
MDANNKIWYQVKEKRWLFWRWFKVARGPLEIAYYEPITFDSFSEAQIWLKKIIEARTYYANSKKQQILECVEV